MNKLKKTDKFVDSTMIHHVTYGVLFTFLTNQQFNFQKNVNNSKQN
jgi:hypothetical protein